jgi:hypothetical protein
MKTKNTHRLTLVISDDIAEQIVEAINSHPNFDGFSKVEFAHRALLYAIASVFEERDNRKESVTEKILQQLADSTLLSDDMSEAILDGNAPAVEDVVMALIVGSRDCAAMTENDPAATCTERRIARQALSIAFLSAIARSLEKKSRQECADSFFDGDHQPRCSHRHC